MSRRHLLTKSTSNNCFSLVSVAAGLGDSYHLEQAGATARAGAGSGGIICTIVCRWGRWTVVTWRILIGLFELKFDRLNINLIDWTEKLVVSNRYGSKKFLKISNFILHPINTSYILSLFYTYSITFSLSSSHTRNIFIQLKRNIRSTHYGVLGHHERSHEHVASERDRDC
jgi:hypothetical protein